MATPAPLWSLPSTEADTSPIPAAPRLLHAGGGFQEGAGRRSPPPASPHWGGPASSGWRSPGRPARWALWAGGSPRRQLWPRGAVGGLPGRQRRGVRLGTSSWGPQTISHPKAFAPLTGEARLSHQLLFGENLHCLQEGRKP